MNQKFNQRFKETENHIKSQLLLLLAEKPVEKISVREICERAHINRSSFYLHFQDIYALLEQIERDFSKELYEMILLQMEEHIDDRSLIQSFFVFFREHAAFYRAMLAGQLSITFFKEAQHSELARRINVLRGLEKQSLYQGNDYHMIYFVGGLQNLLKVWIEKGCRESPETMAEVIYTEYHRSGTKENPSSNEPTDHSTQKRT